MKYKWIHLDTQKSAEDLYLFVHGFHPLAEKLLTSLAISQLQNGSTKLSLKGGEGVGSTNISGVVSCAEHQFVSLQKPLTFHIFTTVRAAFPVSDLNSAFFDFFLP